MVGSFLKNKKMRELQIIFHNAPRPSAVKLMDEDLKLQSNAK